MLGCSAGGTCKRHGRQGGAEAGPSYLAVRHFGKVSGTDFHHRTLGLQRPFLRHHQHLLCSAAGMAGSSQQQWRSPTAWQLCADTRCQVHTRREYTCASPAPLGAVMVQEVPIAGLHAQLLECFHTGIRQPSLRIPAPLILNASDFTDFTDSVPGPTSTFWGHTLAHPSSLTVTHWHLHFLRSIINRPGNGMHGGPE